MEHVQLATTKKFGSILYPGLLSEHSDNMKNHTALQRIHLKLWMRFSRDIWTLFVSAIDLALDLQLV